MTDAQGVFGMVRRHADDSASAWALGTFGAVAEFLRDPDERVHVRLDVDVVEAATDRGAMRLTPHPLLDAVAFERPLSQGRSWSQSIALCLPRDACAMHRRATLTELGPDREAVRPQDREAILFDLGLGALQVDACIRTSDAELIAVLRAAEGASVFDPVRSPMGAILRHGPNRVFCGQIGRIEVFQPIPPPGGVSPEGPHTHLLPKMLRTGRTHAATEPIPAGLVPVVHLGPSHPTKTMLGKPRPFDHQAYAAFQALLAAYGDPAHQAVKHEILAAIADGVGPDDRREGNRRESETRPARAAARVALAQAAALYGETPALDAWRAAMGRDEPADDPDEQSQHG